MTLSKHILFAAMAVIFILACKQEAQVTEDQTATDTPTTPEGTQSSPGTNPNLVANMPWTFLTHELFHHRVTVASGKVDTDVRSGHWMDFNDNGTYDYGIWGDKTYDGTWTYDEATKILQLNPKGNEKKSEWRVMHKEDNLILVGTATYGNNAEQIQWLRRPQRPDKNAQPQVGEKGDQE